MERGRSLPVHATASLSLHITGTQSNQRDIKVVEAYSRCGVSLHTSARLPASKSSFKAKAPAFLTEGPHQHTTGISRSPKFIHDFGIALLTSARGPASSSSSKRTKGKQKPAHREKLGRAPKKNHCLRPASTELKQKADPSFVLSWWHRRRPSSLSICVSWMGRYGNMSMLLYL
jgi:hypothetical protein